MERTAPLLAVTLLLLAGTAVPVGGSATGVAGTAEDAAQVETQTAANESDGAPAPGAQFAGVVAVQAAEVEGELEGRAFGVRVARANSNNSKAGVVADQFEDLQGRIDALAERREALEAARENGSISEARYRAEVAALAARTSAVERRLNQTDATASDLPADLLESRGVNATAIDRLRNRSRSLTGPEAAAIARTIAGPRPGAGLAGGNGTAGPPATPPGRPGPGSGSGPPTDVPGTSAVETEDDERPTPRGPPTVERGGNAPGRPTDAGGAPNATVTARDRGVGEQPGGGGPPNDGGPPNGGGPPADFIGDANWIIDGGPTSGGASP